jgi:hypothetical protein
MAGADFFRDRAPIRDIPEWEFPLSLVDLGGGEARCMRKRETRKVGQYSG